MKPDEETRRNASQPPPLSSIAIGLLNALCAESGIWAKKMEPFVIELRGDQDEWWGFVPGERQSFARSNEDGISCETRLVTTPRDLISIIYGAPKPLSDTWLLGSTGPLQRFVNEIKAPAGWLDFRRAQTEGFS